MNGSSPEFHSVGVEEQHDPVPTHSIQNVQDRLKHIRAGSPFRYRSNPHLSSSTPDSKKYSSNISLSNAVSCLLSAVYKTIIRFLLYQKLQIKPIMFSRWGWFYTHTWCMPPLVYIRDLKFILFRCYIFIFLLWNVRKC